MSDPKILVVKSQLAAHGLCAVELDPGVPLDYGDFFMGTEFVGRLLRPGFPRVPFDRIKVGTVNFRELEKFK